MAGRNISVDREAIGPVRVMRTTGMMGEIVGKAAWLCIRYATTPRGVYESYLPALKELMEQPGAARRDSLDGKLTPPSGTTASAGTTGIDPTKLDGIVVDDTAAAFTGDWDEKGTLSGFIGVGYRYSHDPKATARFPFTVKADGEYEVRATWLPHANRAKKASISVQTADGEKRLTIDQTKAATGPAGFQSLGRFKFSAQKPGYVLYHIADSAGTVHVDAVQIVSVK
jgi:hypothetical protein